MEHSILVSQTQQKGFDVAEENLSKMTRTEISLIKAMLAQGKEAGFTAQKILSYFSRPDRTLNPARIYEIQDGKIGPDIQSADGHTLRLFLAEFGSHPVGQRRGVRIVWTPPPTYLGIVNDRVAVINRRIEQDDARLDLRAKLVEAQRSLAHELSVGWTRFQFDQRILHYVHEYIELTSVEDAEINVFRLDAAFEVISQSIGPDTAALGEVGEVQWLRFSKNHRVLTSLYPEIVEYRVALAEMADGGLLAEDEANRIVELMRSDEGSEYVDSSVPDTVADQMTVKGESPEPSLNKRIYDVVSTLNTAWRYLVALVEITPKLERAVSSGTELLNKLGPLLNRLLDRANF